MVRMRDARAVLIGKRERRDRLEDVGIDGRIILKLILEL
jgi:hypothetical protein